MPNVWGIHNDRLTDELIQGGFISIGWDGTGDLTEIRNGRDGIKSVLSEMQPDSSPMSIANQAGTLLRFRDKMQPGDVIVAPYRPDGTVNLGVITGEYTYHPSEPTHRHRRTVEWKKLGIPRSVFTR